MDILCPKGHVSTDPDYCSECGAKITGAAPASAAPSIAAAPSVGVCPDCGTPRANPTATFCEVCRYNFVTHASWAASAPPVSIPAPPVSIPAPPVSIPAPPVSIPAPPLPTPAPPVAPPAVPTPSLSGWDVVAAVDPALYTEPDPAVPCPVGDPALRFPLDLPENLIGRRSERRGIFPEVPLTDPGVSHRHAKLLKSPDGTVSLLDVGSANGTALNGSSVAAGVETPLREGDQITLGCWTRLTLRKRV